MVTTHKCKFLSLVQTICTAKCLHKINTHALIVMQANIIEGYVKDSRINLYKKKLKEDSIYRIESFMVTPARDSYRVANHPYRIQLSQQTKMTEIIPEPDNFPICACDVKSFDVLVARTKKYTLLSGSDRKLLTRSN
jgi:hypothetical protein